MIVFHYQVVSIMLERSRHLSEFVMYCVVRCMLWKHFNGLLKAVSHLL
jgi:hypothetical protein